MKFLTLLMLGFCCCNSTNRLCNVLFTAENISSICRWYWTLIAFSTALVSRSRLLMASVRRFTNFAICLLSTLLAQPPRDTVAQSPRDTVQAPRSRHLFFLGNLLSCPPTSRLRPRRLLLLVLVGGPKITAACPYPALRLDNLYAALIRYLVLWTFTKQILVFLLQRPVSFSWWVRCDPWNLLRSRFALGWV